MQLDEVMIKRERALQSIGASFEKINQAMEHRGMTTMINNTTLAKAAELLAEAAEIFSKAHAQIEAHEYAAIAKTSAEHARKD